jgi:hypothetical protein
MRADEHRVVGRGEGNLVDDDQRQRLATHVDALPETLAADQDGAPWWRKRCSRSFLLPSPCSSSGRSVTLVLEPRLEQLVGAAHGAQAGAQEESAAAWPPSTAGNAASTTASV